MPLTSGTQVGAYEVIELVGAGGMGEVYRAVDTRLKREVALKVLPASVAAEQDRLLRFAREAEMLAALNHPNIASIYGVEESSGVRALVMELVDGETLADQIARGPIPVTEALSIARQIALALESAHEQGIIHRDLKPANIKLRDDGTVKVLDFGLAKLADPVTSASGTSSMSLSPTITSPALMTSAGMLLGTAAYMSPEQAKGRPADKRSDLWAFGCVLFEMLTGKRAFEADDVSETLAAVLRGDPEWTALPADTPPAVRTLLRRCLDRDRRKRVADAATALFALDEHPNLIADASPVNQTAVRGELDAAVGAVEQRSRRRLLVAAAAGVVLAAAATAVTWWVMRPSPLPVKRFILGSSAFPANQGGHRFAISRSGSHVAYVDGRGASRLFVRRIDRLEPSVLVSPASQPFFSPRGDWIGYLDPIDLTLKRVSVNGPPAVSIAKLGMTMRGATWVDEDTIVISDSEGLKRVSVSGGMVTAITPRLADAVPKGPYVMPVGIPGSDLVVFTIGSSAGVTGGTPTIAVLDLSTNAVTPVLTGGSDAQYVASGHLVYTAGGSLWAVRFNPARLEVLGTAVPVVPDITVSTGAVVAAYAVSEKGTLLYTAGDTAARQRTLVWVDRNGRETPVHPSLPNRAYLYPRLSDDETRVAVDIRDQQNDIWILHLASMALEKFTNNPGQDRSPVWAGDRLLFGSDQEGRSRVFWQAFDRKSPSVALTGAADANRFPLSVTPNGRQAILWHVAGSDETSDLLLVDLSPGNIAGAAPAAQNPRPLVVDQSGAINGIVSPNGSWLAYEANDTTNWEIYVRPFPDGGVIPVTSGGGRQPLWSRSGDELFYLGPGGMMSVRVRPGPNWSAESPKQLFSTAAYYVGETGRPLRSYDVSRDASRFLMLRPVGQVRAADEETNILAVDNWFDELKRLVGE